MRKLTWAFVSLSISSLYGSVPAFSSATPTTDFNIFVELAKKAVPSVVNISTVSTLKGTGSPFGLGGNDDLFRRFFEDFFNHRGGVPRGGGEDEDEDESPRNGEGQKNLPRAMSLGSGFIIDASGLILTNNHVVANADEIKIQFTEDRQEEPTAGEVVGRDPELDLALIKVKSKREMVPVVLGDSDKLQVGEYVIAVGNPFGQGHSVTHGIISAKDRTAPDFTLFAKYLQTDAPINPGNSGGPLMNLKGEVVGINNAIDARAQGIGFAIPISSVKKVLPQLKSKGTVSRGYIGVLVNELTPEIAEKIGVPKSVKAPFVAHVYPGQPADKAGIKPYDLITEVDGKEVHSPGELIEAVTAVEVGQTATLKVLRGSEEKTVKVLVKDRPLGKKESKEKSRPKKEKHKKTRIEVGMSLDDLTPEIAHELGMPGTATGAVVDSIDYGGPADKAGLSRGDVIVEIDRKPIKSVDDFYNHVKEKKSYLLRVRRPDPQGRDGFIVVILDLKRKSK